MPIRIRNSRFVVDYYMLLCAAAVAALLALSRDLLAEEKRVAAMMTNFDLSEAQGFMDRYIAALFLPHTREEFFPTVRERLRNRNSERTRA